MIRRPTSRSRSVLEPVAVALYKKLEPYDPPFPVQGLLDALTFSVEFDSRELEVYLGDEYGWDPEPEVWDLLGSAAEWIETGRQEALQSWISNNRLVCQYRVGDQARYFIFQGSRLSGRVVEVLPNTYQYRMYIPVLGHLAHENLVVDAEAVDSGPRNSSSED